MYALCPFATPSEIYFLLFPQTCVARTIVAPLTIRGSGRRKTFFAKIVGPYLRAEFIVFQKLFSLTTCTCIKRAQTLLRLTHYWHDRALCNWRSDRRRLTECNSIAIELEPICSSEFRLNREILITLVAVCRLKRFFFLRHLNASTQTRIQRRGLGGGW